MIDSVKDSFGLYDLWMWMSDNMFPTCKEPTDFHSNVLWLSTRRGCQLDVIITMNLISTFLFADLTLSSFGRQTHTAQYQTLIHSTWIIACRNSEQVLQDTLFTQLKCNQYTHTHTHTHTGDTHKVPIGLEESHDDLSHHQKAALLHR